MSTTDKPRADLVALLLQFEACAAGGSLYLVGNDAGRAVCEWCDLRGHRLHVGTLTRQANGATIAWTHYTVQGSDWTVTCALDDDHEVTAPTAQADQQVLARVQEVLDGERADAADYECTACGATMQSYDQFNEYQHEDCGGLVQRKQPEAAEGSV